MSVIKVNNITNRDGTSGPVIAGITTVSSTSHLVVPTGSTGQRVALAPDPYINNLVLALPFNSESVFTDVSPKGNADPSIIGIATTTSSLPFGITGVTTTSSGIVTFSKYYGTSAYFDGTDDYILFSGTPLFTFAAESYTIEMWFRPTNLAASKTIFSIGNLGSVSTDLITLEYQETGKLHHYVAAYGISSPVCKTDNVLNTGQWYHVAVVRNVNTWTMYLDGQAQTTSVTSPSSTTSGNFLCVGSSTNSLSSRGYVGYIQDLRVYRGVAKYTSNFTPPNQIAL